ncbi:enoyl-CoA hydratase/isomerase family protein [Chloroflexota bacterium]
MTFKQTLHSNKRKGVTVITMNRPEALNTITLQLVTEMESHLYAAATDETIRAVVITGAGRAFCAGGDLTELDKGISGLVPPPDYPSQGRATGRTGIQRLARAVAVFHKPLIAQVNGDAIGAGMDIASMCDYRIVSTKARFALSHLKVARISADGGYFFLTRILSPAKVLELAWTGRIIDADEALAIGYVNMIVPPDQLEEKALEFAAQLAEGPAVAVELAKQVVYGSLQMPFEESLQQAELAGAICEITEDAREAIKAFVEKRKPVFKGR